MKYSPSIDSTDFREIARANFIWKVVLMSVIIFLGLSILMYILHRSFFLYYFIASIFTFGCLLLIRFTKHYKLGVGTLLLGSAVIVNLSIYIAPHAPHFQQGIWMICIVLVAFYTVGIYWGIFYLLVNSVSYAYYYNITLKDIVINSPERLELMFNVDKLGILSVEFAASMFIIGYTMLQFRKISNFSYNELLNTLSALQIEKNIVDKQKVELENQNKEKTVLLQEIHHRVKNNLQVIVSLFRIQARNLKSKESLLDFQDAISRVMTMALIHQKMYEKESIATLDIKDYFETLLNDLISIHSSESKNINYKVESDLEIIDADILVPLGIIINELTSNTLKHAFTHSEKENLIHIHFFDEQKDTFRMTYFDNGKWKENKGNSFGTQLISIFTDQLDGSFEQTMDDTGTRYNFVLKYIK